MNVNIEHGPGNAVAKVQLEGGETCVAEGGAMITMSSDLSVETTTRQRDKGGILSAAKRLLGGESMFLNHFTAGPSGGDLWLSTDLPGDMISLELGHETLMVQAGSWVACEDSVDLDVSWQGMKSLFGGEGFFWLRLTGPGRVIINSFGALYPIDKTGEYVVDTGHIVAFQETMEYNVTKAAEGWISSILGGEGLVCRFHGPGKVWAQTHCPPTFGRTLGPMLKARD